MGLIQESDKPIIKEKLSAMKSDVTLRYFTQEIECEYCRETHELLAEVAELEPRIKLQVFDFVRDTAEAAKFRIDKIPATVVANGNDSRIRFYGIPAGYEFASLLEAIVMVSRGESGLSPESKEVVKQINAPVHLQVFVTPT